MNRRNILTLLACGAVFGSCAPVPPGSAKNAVPVLKSDIFEKTWITQHQGPRNNGGHEITYRRGTSLNMVMISSMPKAEPVPATPPPVKYVVEDASSPYGATRERPQAWRHATILGQSVKWFQVDEGGGADFPAYETVVFPLIHPDGRKGYYRIRVLAESAALAEQWIPQVNW